MNLTQPEALKAQLGVLLSAEPPKDSRLWSVTTYACALCSINLTQHSHAAGACILSASVLEASSCMLRGARAA